jgi:GNAT superfamily N-acetyltransferase
MVLRECGVGDFERMYAVINDAARAYKGVIPADRWGEPYMPREELIDEIKAGVRFYGWFEGDRLVGVMGIQRVMDVTLIRHAYVMTEFQGRGVGSRILTHLKSIAETPTVLAGTWAAATWAVRFYEKHGFQLVSGEEKNQLLRRYWTIPERQVETSVVLKLKWI